MFGEHLTDVAAEITARLAGHGRSVRTVGSPVIRLRQGPAGSHAFTGDGRCFDGLDHVALCVGVDRPATAARSGSPSPSRRCTSRSSSSGTPCPTPNGAGSSLAGTGNSSAC
ncbi:hypothetical protein ACQP10_19225 [Streptosporangium sandarakinum]|uniref:hypothetical protein n=1 Tax=Streptosporangium sandarakinum TaxID=1260955 RepID=UPI003D94C7C6